MIWLNLRYAQVVDAQRTLLIWAALAVLVAFAVASLLSSPRKNIMKLIERLKAAWALISDALVDTISEDIPMKDWPKLIGPVPAMPPCKEPASGPYNLPSGLIVLDTSLLSGLDPLERKEALDTIKWLSWRTQAVLGPGEWFQVIRRRKVDGQFVKENLTEDLFNGKG